MQYLALQTGTGGKKGRLGGGRHGDVHASLLRVRNRGAPDALGECIEIQRQELVDLLRSGVLRSHAQAVLAEVYAAAVEQAVAETGLPPEAFPDTCPFTLDQVLSPDILGDS